MSITIEVPADVESRVRDICRKLHIQPGMLAQIGLAAAAEHVNPKEIRRMIRRDRRPAHAID